MWKLSEDFQEFGGGDVLVNLLTLMEYATCNLFSPEEKGISIPLWLSLVQRCGFTCQTHKKNKEVFYRLRRDQIPCVRLYTREDKSSLNFIDMADLHIGHPECDEERIKEALRYAVNNKVDYVFIAGDILDGVFEPDCSSQGGDWN